MSNLIPFVPDGGHDWEPDGEPHGLNGLGATLAQVKSGAAHDAPAPLGRTGIQATRWAFKVPSTIPPREFLGGGFHYIRKRVSVDIAAGAGGKSSLLRVEAVGMAIGRNLLNGQRFEPLRVWFHAGEDDRDENDRCFAAICIHYQISEEDIGGRLFVDNGKDMPVVIAYQRRGDVEIATPVLERLKAEILANLIDVMIVDPLVKYHHVPENANEAIEQVINEFGKIANECNISVALAHHARKLNGNSISAEDSRGGGSLIANVRSARTLRHMTEEEAAKADIRPEDRKLFFRIDGAAKANLIPPSSAATWRRMVSVYLNNGTDRLAQDSVGVVTAWEWPDPFANTTLENLKEVQRKVAAGRWRENHQAGDWVGVAVAEIMDIDLEDKAGKERVRLMIKAWIRSEALKVVQGTDEKSRPRPYVEVGKWV